MRRPKLRLTLRVMLLATLVLAAFLSGRRPWQQLDARNKRLNLQFADARAHAALWRNIAVDQRPDIRNSKGSLRAETLDRQTSEGVIESYGYSLVRSQFGPDVIPRFQRWEFNCTRENADFLRVLEALHISVIGVWDEPPKVMQWSNPSSRFEALAENDKILDQLMIAGSQKLLSVLPSRIFLNDNPDYILAAMPRSVENELALIEMQSIQNQNLVLENIQSTIFDIEVIDGRTSIKVSHKVRK